MKPEEKKLIKKALYCYKKFMSEAVISTVDWAESNFAVDYSKVSVQTSPGNYKETQLCGILDNNLKKMRLCHLVEKVLEHFKFEQDKVKFIQVFYFERKGEVKTCLNVGISRRTLYRWQDEVIDIAYKWAKELKLIGE